MRWDATGRTGVALAVLALLARLIVPAVPVNWYFTIANLPWTGRIFTQSTAYLPLPMRLIAFDLSFGFDGLVGLNLITGIACVLMAWHAARRSGYGENLSLVLGLLVAVTPMYVRLSVSDSTHLIPLALWLSSALAFAAVRDGERGIVLQCVLFSATALGCLFRAEAALLMPAVPLFVGVNPQGWKALWLCRRRFVGYALGLGFGMVLLFSFHSGNINAFLHGRGIVGLSAFTMYGLYLPLMVQHLLLPAVPALDLFLPSVVLLPIWYWTAYSLRRKAWTDLATVFGPMAIFSFPPVLSMHAGITNLPSTGYFTIYVLLLFLACGKGCLLLYGRFLDGRVLASSWKRVVAAALAAPLLTYSFFVTYRMNYGYQEEFRFLRKSLPTEPAKVLTVWDPTQYYGDYDCCLAMPYPTMLVDFPQLEWTVLSEAAYASGEWRNLRFDYYFPGSMSAIDINNFSRPRSLVRTGAIENDVDVERVRTVQRMDQAIRSEYALEPVAHADVRVATFSHYDFPHGRLELTLYRRRADG